VVPTVAEHRGAQPREHRGGAAGGARVAVVGQIAGGEHRIGRRIEGVDRRDHPRQRRIGIDQTV
jgi:hypothetical protein